MAMKTVFGKLISILKPVSGNPKFRTEALDDERRVGWHVGNGRLALVATARQRRVASWLLGSYAQHLAGHRCDRSDIWQVAIQCRAPVHLSRPGRAARGAEAMSDEHSIGFYSGGHDEHKIIRPPDHAVSAEFKAARTGTPECSR